MHNLTKEWAGVSKTEWLLPTSTNKTGNKVEGIYCTECSQFLCPNATVTSYTANIDGVVNYLSGVPHTLT